MYQLYIANKNYSSWSLRPWSLLTALNIPFQETLTPFTSAAAQPAFKVFSPTGKVPCLVDGDVTVWDSLSIVEYLAERHPGVWPQDAKARAWARSAAAEMHSGLGALRSQCGMNCGVRVKLPAIDAALQGDIDRVDALWQQGLERFGGPFLAGSAFSAVDAFFAPVVFRFQTYGLPLNAVAEGYQRRMLSHPALQQWMEQALKETWREPGHEEETLGAGTLLKDFRVAP